MSSKDELDKFSELELIRELERRIANREKEETPTEVVASKDSLFTGMAFRGPAVSEEQYMKHYREYRERCSAL
ncbi:hypothetical protein [Lacticaseibacillus zhaodongensis]|uniref:hypothetical protein n=1 Tax=Lacticaseibacillus zhaodongensis TaxID=2668065 RepID=UPI0012D2CF28|nr:hypothetical protein [Lacticaseibacillus zhaodongensis]